MNTSKKRIWRTSRQFPGLVVEQGRGTVADCNILLASRTEQENLANAKLIALSPEMMYCLIAMDGAIDAHKAGKGINGIYAVRKQIRKLLVRLADNPDKS